MKIDGCRSEPNRMLNRSSLKGFAPTACIKQLFFGGYSNLLQREKNSSVYQETKIP